MHNILTWPGINIGNTFNNTQHDPPYVKATTKRLMIVFRTLENYSILAPVEGKENHKVGTERKLRYTFPFSHDSFIILERYKGIPATLRAMLPVERKRLWQFN